MKARQWSLYGLIVSAAIALLASCGGQHDNATSLSDLTSAQSSDLLARPVLLDAKYGSTGPTVNLSVQASDTFGNLLSYEWKSTDGSIVNVNASSTTWTLPNGPGLHFAYVL
jgi:hypothetical protein